MTDMFKARQDFLEVLAEIGRSRSREERAGERFVNPTAGAAFPFVAGAWRGAPAWPEDVDFFEADEPPAAAELPLSDDPEAIARELGLDQARSERDLDQARRRFMWRHHPDRCEESQRARADRRVAGANMLIDRARARLAGRRS
jgi:hypothetical protein